MKARATLFFIFFALCLALFVSVGDQAHKTVRNLNVGTGETPRSDFLSRGPSSFQPVSAVASGAARQQVLVAYTKLPLSFEANRGQTDGQVRFLAHGGGYTLFLTPTEAVLSLHSPQPSAANRRRTGRLGRTRKEETSGGTVLRIKLAGANSAPQILGLGELPGKTNYFIGKDPTKWRSNIPLFARVKYQDIYPGIDLVYYGNQRELEHDFIVAPGANPGAITLDLEAAGGLKIDARGDLALDIKTGEILLTKPHAYQEMNGTTRDIPARYVLKSQRQVGFEVSAYDATKPLIVDPVLSYASYLGGSGDDIGFGVAVDTAGKVYVTGITSSANFPTTPGARQTVFGGMDDAFVTKIDPTQSGAASLVYSTYLGGSNLDEGFGIAVDSSGNAYVAGLTASADFPTVGAFQAAFNGGIDDAFVSKLNAAGSALLYSTYLGGNDDDEGFAIATDNSGNAFVTGLTASTNFPTTAGAFQAVFGGLPDDAFVTKIDTTKTGAASLIYSTYLGGIGDDQGFGIALDSSGNTYVVGLTAATNFPTTVGAFQTVFGGGLNDAFVAKFDTTKSSAASLVYSTYLGGSGDDQGFGIAVNSSGNAHVTGITSSVNFPTTSGAFQTVFGGGAHDAFLTKLSTAGNAPLAYSTYLGGSGDDQGFGVGLDSTGNAYVAGFTFSTNFPTSPAAFQSALAGADDVFVTKIDTTKSGAAALAYSTYYGGNSTDEAFGLAADSAGNAYVTGRTFSSNLPTKGAFQPTLAGSQNAFVAKIAAAAVVNLSPISLTFAGQTVGTTSTAQTVTLTNTGDAALTIASIATSGDFAQTNTCGSSVAAGTNCTISVTFTPTASGTRSGTLTVTDNAAGSPQTVALSGTGADFSISASPTSANVNAGKSATYTLTVTPAGGFNQAVALTCSGAPVLSTCSISPSSVTLNGTSASTATVTVATTAPSMVPPQLQPPRPGSGLRIRLPWLALLAAVVTLAALAAARRRRVSWLVPALAILVFLVVLGCAAGGGTPKGVSTLTLKGTSGTLSHSTTVNLVVF